MNIETEISATIAWNELNKYKRKPLLWNIFPFHPYKENNNKTNRTPTNPELNFWERNFDATFRDFPS